MQDTQQYTIEKEIRVLSEEMGIYVTSLYNQQVFTENDMLGKYRYILYNGERMPLSYSIHTQLPTVYMKYSKVQECDKRLYAIDAKKVLDYEHLRQLASEKKIYIIAVNPLTGSYHCYDMQWVKEDSLGYNNVLYITEHFYGNTVYNKIVLSYTSLQNRLPLLSDMIYSGTVYQVAKESDLYTTFFHPNTTQLEVLEEIGV